jgi:hypothetical protein
MTTSKRMFAVVALVAALFVGVDANYAQDISGEGLSLSAECGDGPSDAAQAAAVEAASQAGAQVIPPGHAKSFSLKTMLMMAAFGAVVYLILMAAHA